jgi:hypothetical protein
VHLGSALSVRSFLRFGSSLSIYNLVKLGSAMSLLDYCTLGSSLSLRSFGLLGSSLSVYGVSKLGSTLSVLDFMSVGSVISMRSFVAWVVLFRFTACVNAEVHYPLWTLYILGPVSHCKVSVVSARVCQFTVWQLLAQAYQS